GIWNRVDLSLIHSLIPTGRVIVFLANSTGFVCVPSDQVVQRLKGVTGCPVAHGKTVLANKRRGDSTGNRRGEFLGVHTAGAHAEAANAAVEFLLKGRHFGVKAERFETFFDLGTPDG